MRIFATALVVLGTVSAVVLSARQTAPAQATVPAQAVQTDAPAPAQPAPTALMVPPAGRVFASDAGLVLSTVRGDKVADFERVMERIHEALSRTTDPARRAQAAGWKVFRATEPGPGSSVLFVFVMDPAVTGADYTVSRVLGEAFPDEVQELFRLYNGAVLGQSLLSLNAVERFGEPWTAVVPGAPKRKLGEKK